VRILGVLLLILGAVALGYQGFTYVSNEPVAQISSLQVRAERDQTVWVPPLIGGVALASGLIVLVATLRRE
jgi:hypothetical protein